MNTKTVDLMSLYNNETNDVTVPKGTHASYDSSKGPCLIKGKLVNHGTITITGSKKSSQVIVTSEITNDGDFVSEVESLSLCTAKLQNAGEIKAESRLCIESSFGKLAIDGSGSVTAVQSITFASSVGITVRDGTFASSSLSFAAENGTVVVLADRLDGAISVNAKSSRIGTKSEETKAGKSALLSGTHVYYSTSNLSLGNISHAGDAVVLLAGGEISVGSITAGTLYVGAGVSFTIDGQFPDPTSDNDVDVPWSVSGPGYQPLEVAGAITVSGEATIKAWTVEATDITVGGNLDILTLNEYGEITITGDLDVDGNASLLAYTITFEGEDFNVAGELVVGGSAPTSMYSYINLAGSFTASDNVNLNCQLTTFLGDDFTMDGDDKVLTTSGHLRIEASDFISIKADVTTTDARNLLFYCDGDVATGSITVDNTEAPYAGAVIIKAHRAGGSSEFVIGGTDESNGVNGTITTDTADGGATEVTSYSHGCVYITNGGDGGITITNAGDISVKGTNSKSGGITLNAEDGTIKLPSGTLSAAGTGSNPGSFIQLLAETLETVDGTIISVSDDGTTDTQKLVQIATNNITLTGTNGLEIKANGGGNSAYPTYLQIFPKGSVTLYDNDYAPSFLYWYNNETISNAGAAPVAFDGAGTAPLKITCNGSHSRTFISGYPLVFDTGETQIECKGDEDHEIQISRYSASGGDGLQFIGGDVTIDASGLDDGDGGLVAVYMDPVYRSDTGKIVMKSDGKDTGDGGHILLQPGTTDLVFGTADEQFSFSAKGGLSSGSGGKIEIQGYSSSIEVNGATDTTTVLDVSVPGTDGNGGEINIVAYGATGLSFDASNPSYLKADGGSASGDGGKIIIVTSNVPMTIGSGNGDVSLSAAAKDGDGAGGTVDILSWYGITADTLSVDVSAEGEGDGGIIKLNAGYSLLELNGGEIHADSGDNGGSGGLVHLEGGSISLPSVGATLVTANGEGNGNGGTIEVVTQFGSVNFGTGNSEIKIEAIGGATSSAKSQLVDINGAGGTIRIVQQQTFAVDGSGLFVNSFSDGTGGIIDISCTDQISIDGYVGAPGAGNGTGGTITLESPKIVLGDNASFNADGGSNGEGGSIEILASTSGLRLANSITACGNGTGNGGRIELHGTSFELDYPNHSPQLLARGGSSGAGGEIIVEVDSVVNLLSTFQYNVFDARGFDEGAGGRVTLNSPGDSFYLPSVIWVDSGDNASSSVFGGAITLNEMTVYRKRTSYSDFPRVIWSLGASLNSADISVAAAANSLPSAFKSTLANWTLYLFPAPSDADQFLDKNYATSQPASLGVTEDYFSCVFLQSATLVTNPHPQATTVHELGHAFNYLSGNLAAASSFTTALATTKSSLDGQDPTCAVEFSGTNICSIYPNETNYQRFLLISTANSPAASEIWAYLFEAKACIEGSLNGYSNRIAQYPHNGAVTTYFDNLWP